MANYLQMEYSLESLLPDMKVKVEHVPQLPEHNIFQGSLSLFKMVKFDQKCVKNLSFYRLRRKRPYFTTIHPMTSIFESEIYPLPKFIEITLQSIIIALQKSFGIKKILKMELRKFSCERQFWHFN